MKFPNSLHEVSLLISANYGKLQTTGCVTGQEVEEKQEGGESVATGRQIKSHCGRRLQSEHTAAGTQFINTGT